MLEDSLFLCLYPYRLILFVSFFLDFLYSCKNGKEGKGLGVTFKPHFLDEKKNYKNGEIYLFFSKCVRCKNNYIYIVYIWR